MVIFVGLTPFAISWATRTQTHTLLYISSLILIGTFDLAEKSSPIQTSMFLPGESCIVLTESASPKFDSFLDLDLHASVVQDKLLPICSF